MYRRHCVHYLHLTSDFYNIIWYYWNKLYNSVLKYSLVFSQHDDIHNILCLLDLLTLLKYTIQLFEYSGQSSGSQRCVVQSIVIIIVCYWPTEGKEAHIGICPLGFNYVCKYVCV